MKHRQTPRTRFCPWLRFAVHRVAVAAGLRTGGEYSNLLLSAMELSSEKAPDEFPPGVPTFPALRAVTLDGTPERGLLSASARATCETVLDHYLDAFAARRNWVPDDAQSDPAAGLFVFRDATADKWCGLLCAQPYSGVPLTTVIIAMGSNDPHAERAIVGMGGARGGEVSRTH